MAKKTNHIYVLVMTDEGPKFVTSYEGKTAHWDKAEKPIELSKSMAESMTIGLAWNGHSAFVVSQPFEIDYQPYRYDFGHFEWKDNEESGSAE